MNKRFNFCTGRGKLDFQNYKTLKGLLNAIIREHKQGAMMGWNIDSAKHALIHNFNFDAVRTPNWVINYCGSLAKQNKRIDNCEQDETGELFISIGNN